MNLADILSQLRADATDQKITIPSTWHQGRTAYGGLSSALAYQSAKLVAPDLPPLLTAQIAFSGPLSGEVGFDADKGDVQGPLTLGLLLTRSVAGEKPADAGADAKLPEKPQRVALVGDSDFLSNAFIGQLGNAKLGLNLARWLASRDDQLDITIPAARDQSLNLSPLAALLIQLGFLLLLPLTLLAVGIGRWLSRRRR